MKVRILIHVLELSYVVYVCLYGHKIVERTLRIERTVGICYSTCTSLQYKLIVSYHDNHFLNPIFLGSENGCHGNVLYNS